MWIGGIIVVAYFGYTYIIDPFFIQGTPTVKGTSINPSPIDPTGGVVGGDDITIGSRAIDVAKSIGSIISTIKSKLNPFNWLLASSSVQDVNNQFQSFIENQNDLVTADRRFYPFTEINPYDSYFKRLRISWLGETTYELSNRMREKAYAIRELEQLRVTNPYSPISDSYGVLAPLSGFGTPSIGNVGLYRSGSGIVDMIGASSSYNEVFNKVSSLPPTPTQIPTSLPIKLEELSSVNPSWLNHAADPKEMANYLDKKDGFTYAKAVAKGLSSKTPFKLSDNKFTVLSEEIE